MRKFNYIIFYRVKNLRTNFSYCSHTQMFCGMHAEFLIWWFFNFFKSNHIIHSDIIATSYKYISLFFHLIFFIKNNNTFTSIEILVFWTCWCSMKTQTKKVKVKSKLKIQQVKEKIKHRIFLFCVCRWKTLYLSIYPCSDKVCYQ